MGVNKLDIEFEDEDEIQAREEAERKKSEVPEDVDLSFGAVEETGGLDLESDEPEVSPEPVKVAPQQKAEPQAAAPKKQAPPQQVAQPAAQPVQQQPVQQVVQQPVQQAAAATQFQQMPTAQVFIGPDYKLGDELKKVAASNQVLAIEIEARVKVEVTQQLTNIIAEHHAKNKLIEHKINKILTTINQKVPALKNELMTIKKLLQEHATLGEGESSEESAPAAQSGGATDAEKQKILEQRRRAALAAKKKKAA